MPMPARKLAKIIAALTLLSVLAHAKVLPIAFSYGGGGILPLALAAAGLLYFALGAASITGIWMGRSWGFFSFYAHVILGTVVFGISVVPFLPALLPPEARLWVVLGVNLLAVAVIGAVQWRLARERP